MAFLHHGFLHRGAEHTDINIIVATALHTYDEIPHQYEHRRQGCCSTCPVPR